MKSLQRTVLAAALLFAAPASLFAAPPTAEEMMQKVRKMYEVYQEAKFEGQPTPEQMEELNRKLEARAIELLEGVDVAELSDEARNAGQRLIAASPEHRAQVDAMLAERAKANDAAGFKAACERVGYVDPKAMQAEGPANAMSERLLAAVDHPAAVDAAKAGEMGELPWYLGQLSKEDLAARGSRLAEMAKALAQAPEAGSAMMATEFLSSLSAALPREQFEPARVAVAESLSARASSETNDKIKSQLERGVKLLNGAAMRGELLDHAVPALTFRKVYGADSTGAQLDAAPWSSMADLKGKVVVLDFWATWCGPCVGSFPQVKELRAQYSPNDLEIVGVTSIQGFIATKDHQQIDCEGDPAKEEAEMKKYLNEAGVTWTVGITEEDVFNPDFGISGIPFVAIVDREGIVRRVGLHPMNHEEIVKVIDELLAKAPATQKSAAVH